MEPDGGTLSGVLEVATGDDAVQSIVFDAREDSPDPAPGGEEGPR